MKGETRKQPRGCVGVPCRQLCRMRINSECGSSPMSAAAWRRAVPPPPSSKSSTSSMRAPSAAGGVGGGGDGCDGGRGGGRGGGAGGAGGEAGAVAAACLVLSIILQRTYAWICPWISSKRFLKATPMRIPISIHPQQIWNGASPGATKYDGAEPVHVKAA